MISKFELCNYFSAETEIFSLVDKPDDDSTLEPYLTNFVLPNAMFINGIAINQNDTENCQETQIGMNNKINSFDSSINAYYIGNY